MKEFQASDWTDFVILLGILKSDDNSFFDFIDVQGRVQQSLTSWNKPCTAAQDQTRYSRAIFTATGWAARLLKKKWILPIRIPTNLQAQTWFLEGWSSSNISSFSDWVQFRIVSGVKRLRLGLEVKEEFDNKLYLPILFAPKVNAGKMRWSRLPPESAVGPRCEV